ncbi:histidine kinase [Thiorhodococcus mannitoliphagus]|uniref:Histidine kinase n=1 Tax=Thiorhodococcus mannitoliphagus TaxID=329406 RepID=A0A6P1E373_9GAMM|nr:FIST C-terminal domain-containing protein [Thiorhodococcus mannitoliphagus]NEX23516.1 histidine kinase [Thiorhodococcus mannitoliphagus]
MKDDSLEFCATLDVGCLSPLIERWRAGSSAGCVLALVAESECSRLPILQSTCRAAGLSLVGGLFPGLVWQQRFLTHGALLIYLPWQPVYALVDRLDLDESSSAVRIAAAAQDHLDPSAPPTFFMVFDAMVPNIASILDELYLELADGVRYLGVNAGSERFQPMPCVFDSERLIGKGALCLLLPHDWSSALIHGYHAPEETLTATATVGNKIVRIDWQPAFPVYRDKVLARYGIALDHDNFYRYAVHFPFGIALASGQTLVRIPVALDEDEGILCVGEVPANALLTLLQSPEVDSVDTARALADVFAPARRSDPLLFFYCAGRRLHLGEGAERELRVCERETGARLVGALSLGEIGGVGDASYPLLHNAAVVGVDWGEPDRGPA